MQNLSISNSKLYFLCPFVMKYSSNRIVLLTNYEVYGSNRIVLLTNYAVIVFT